MKTVLAGLALVTLAGGAFAQDNPPPSGGPGPRGGMGMGMMMRADTNGDGVVTRDEYLAQMTERFNRMDLNHDGKLTRDELEQVGGRMRGMRGGGDMPPPPQQPQN